MSERTTIALCILWEDELRTASRLLAAANDLPDGDPGMANALQAAYAACAVALHGLTDYNHPVLIGSDGLRKRGKGK